MTLVFTICSNNYLTQAIILGNSLLRYNPDYDFKIGLVDKKSSAIDYSKLAYEIIEVEEIGITGFDEMYLRYNIVELNTSVKPFYFKYFISKNKYEKLIYLDPDIEVFAPFSKLERELENNNIVITPHFLTPINDDKWQAEEDFLNSGIYNLGFIAFSNTPNSIKMIEWWAERLKTKAHINFSKGLFTDQIWINFVPLFFEKVVIFRDPGYNVAYWNLHERHIIFKNNSYFINDIHPLIFYHYASFRPLNPSSISLHQTRYDFSNRPDIRPLFEKYCDALINSDYEKMNNVPCYYVNLKLARDKEIYLTNLRKYPLYKKLVGKFVRFIINRLNLVLDYRKL